VAARTRNTKSISTRSSRASRSTTLCLTWVG
jgi:hypothetical protein